jgi:hypothetical protein
VILPSAIHFTTVKNWASHIWPAKPGVPPEEIGGGTNITVVGAGVS